MMRSSSLKSCLDSRYVWFDETANTLVKKDLESADKFAKEMRAGKDALDQLNTAYMAVYCATNALLHSINYKASNYRCIISVLIEYFVVKGMLDKNDVQTVLKTQKLEGTPEENFEAADKFVAKVKQILAPPAAAPVSSVA
jgi:uncharacterized protein (UPF0332 family)